MAMTASTRTGIPFEKLVVMHLDGRIYPGTGKRNRHTNLKWGTYRQNNQAAERIDGNSPWFGKFREFTHEELADERWLPINFMRCGIVVPQSEEEEESEDESSEEDESTEEEEEEEEVSTCRIS